MKIQRIPFISIISISLFLITLSLSFAETKVTTTGKVGDAVTIEGSIAPGQELYLAIAQQNEFKPADATMPHEKKKFESESTKQGFNMDTAIPPLYYLLTSNPTAFGEKTDTKFGGPSITLSYVKSNSQAADI